MKKQFTLFSVLALSGLVLSVQEGQAQDMPPVIIRATTVMTPPDNGGDEPALPMETATVISVKGNFIKVESKSDRAHTITIIDKGAHKTTSLTEAGGRKFGYFSIDTARATGDTNQRRRPATSLQYSDETKTILGYTCKKAVATRTFGNRSMSTTIWYTTDFILKSPIPMGGRGFGFGGFNELNGFPMEYDASLPNGLTIKYQITKVEQNAKLSDSDFDIPRGYDVKPESERPRGGFGGFGGGPGGGGPGGGGGFGGGPGGGGPGGN